MVRWNFMRASDTMDTIEQRQDMFVASREDWERLKGATRRYIVGDMPPHYPVPACLMVDGMTTEDFLQLLLDRI